MSELINHPWVVSIVGGIISSLLAGVLLSAAGSGRFSVLGLARGMFLMLFVGIATVVVWGLYLGAIAPVMRHHFMSLMPPDFVEAAVLGVGLLFSIGIPLGILSESVKGR